MSRGQSDEPICRAGIETQTHVEDTGSRKERAGHVERAALPYIHDRE